MKVAIFVICSFLTIFASPANWRIIGGQDAEVGQFPYQVSLRTRGSHSCGGSILDATTILSAAHCVAGGDSSSMTIRVGSNKLNQQIDEYAVKTYRAHDDYNPFKVVNDIAIIKLRKPIQFHAGVEALQLRQTNIGDDDDVILSGWGSTNYPSVSDPNDLQSINLKTISVKECTERHPEKPIYDSQVCTLTQKGEGACHGDSGGPLVDANKQQIGVVSWGTPCARGKPDVFTRIYSFLDWIERNRH